MCLYVCKYMCICGCMPCRSILCVYVILYAHINICIYVLYVCINVCTCAHLHKSRCICVYMFVCRKREVCARKYRENTRLVYGILVIIKVFNKRSQSSGAEPILVWCLCGYKPCRSQCPGRPSSVWLVWSLVVT